MRYRGFDLNLVTLRSLLDTRRVSEMAPELNVPRPAVSSALKRLRVQSGQRKFITEFAERLSAPVERLLASADALLMVRQ